MEKYKNFNSNFINISYLKKLNNEDILKYIKSLFDKISISGSELVDLIESELVLNDIFYLFVNYQPAIVRLSDQEDIPNGYKLNTPLYDYTWYFDFDNRFSRPHSNKDSNIVNIKDMIRYSNCNLIPCYYMWIGSTSREITFDSNEIINCIKPVLDNLKNNHNIDWYCNDFHNKKSLSKYLYIYRKIL